MRLIKIKLSWGEEEVNAELVEKTNTKAIATPTLTEKLRKIK